MTHPAFANTRFFPFWLDSPAAPAVEPELRGERRAGVVVIGGGFTGLWAAIQAKEADPRQEVVLIEAGKVAHGASGRPCGIISTSIMHGLANAARVFPKDIDQLEELGRLNLDGFQRDLERFGIDADVEWNGELTAAIEPGHVDVLREDYELHLEHGHDMLLLDAGEARAQIDSPLFHGALWGRQRSGTIHPAKLAWGLKAAALKVGVKLYENSPLERIVEEGQDLVLHTPVGVVRTARAFFATGCAKVGIGDINRRVMNVQDHIMATEPLTAEQLARVGWQNRQGFYDTRTQLNYGRLTKDNRIIFGGSVTYHYGEHTDPDENRRPETYAGLVDAFFKTFPQLHDVKFSHAWGGPIDYCSRGSVFVTRYFGGKAVFVAGYTGFGVAASRFGATMGLNTLFGRKDAPEQKLDIARKGTAWIPPGILRWLGAKITFIAFDGADAEGGWKRAWIKSVKALGFPM
ncbi:FAD-binding oxidoreductase [Pelomonas sp. KK5]|uniref:NAD(P)/FAD-dependent oxidoreductase n=1 Tax=Pelomonas sp. KK5 TaxID=1855730 RepID=UPI00097C2331|nr:FAD-dependent oxidoreductase [Pelomonas sp. KK5]